MVIVIEHGLDLDTFDLLRTSHQDEHSHQCAKGLTTLKWRNGTDGLLDS